MKNFQIAQWIKEGEVGMKVLLEIVVRQLNSFIFMFSPGYEKVCVENNQEVKGLHELSTYQQR